MPYKNPEEKKYQANWHTNVRRDWLIKQKCELCGRCMNLRVFKHVGTPKLSWGLKGPSHDEFRVVCGDAIACLQRQSQEGKPEEEEGPKPRKHRHATVRKGKVVIVELDELAPQSGPSKLAKQLEKKDVRPVCTTRYPNGQIHGPNNTTVLHKDGRQRFICCGRMVE